MIKISDAVRDIVFESEIALTSLSEGYLNLSAYAKIIKKEIEDKTKKPLKTGSIVVALSRLSRDMKKQKSLLPNIIVENISVKSGLVEMTFDKTEENRNQLKILYQDKRFTSADFSTVTQGVGEISVVVPEHLKTMVISVYKSAKPKLLLENLASLTITIDGKHIEIPNTFFAIIRNLALKRINIVEVISTYTELTFILHQKDLEEAFLRINKMFRKD